MFIYLKLANWFCRVSNSFLAQFAKVTEQIEFIISLKSLMSTSQNCQRCDAGTRPLSTEEKGNLEVNMLGGRLQKGVRRGFSGVGSVEGIQHAYYRSS